MAWAAIERVTHWVTKRKEILAAVVGVAVEEMAGCFPGAGLGAKLVGEVTRYGVSRLLDPKAALPDLKPAGQALPAAQIDEINAYLEKLTGAYAGLLDRLQELAAPVEGEAALAELVRRGLQEREDLAREFAASRAEVRGLTLSLSRVEEKLDEQVHLQNRMAVSLEDYKAYLIELPGFHEYLQMPAAERAAMRQAHDHFRAGRRAEGAGVLLGLLKKQGLGHATVCHQLGLVYLGEGKVAEARRCLEQAGEGRSWRSTAAARTFVHSTTTGRHERVAGWRSLPRGFLVDRRWRIEAEVGRGGMASVYRAAGVDLVNRGRTVALKVPAPGLMADDRTRERFLQEILVSQRLAAGRHPAIVETLNYAVFDDPHSGRELYGLVLEYIEGVSLARLLARRKAQKQPLTPREILAVLRPVCAALEYAHGQDPPVLHRDLKPQNVMVGRDGKCVKLMDFGIARLLDDSDGATTVGGPVGTPAYMPPEMFNPEAVLDVRADVYQAGNLLLELMTFSPQGDAEVRGDCPPQWVDLIADSMNRIRGKRPASMREFLDRLAPEERAVPVPAPTPAPPPPAGPVTATVGRNGHGQYATITEALRAVPPGGRVLVRPGRYLEGLVLDRPVEVVGEGPRDEIIVESTSGPCVHLQTDRATVRGLRLRGRCPMRPTGDLTDSTVFVPRGELVLEDCDVTSAFAACVAVEGPEAAPVLRRCRLHEAAAQGLYFTDRARGTAEDCDVRTCGVAGVVVLKGANPTLRGCKVQFNKQAGVLVWDRGQGVFEGCDVCANGTAGVQIQQGGKPTLRHCLIHGHANHNGVLVADGGEGLLEDCSVFTNAYAGVAIKAANPTLRNCTVRDGKQGGVLVVDAGRGVLEDCDISANALAGVEVQQGGNPVVRRCKIHDGKQGGVFVWDKGRGLFEDCEVSANALTGVAVKGADPVLRGCHVHHGKQGGILVLERGRGTVENCDVSGNAFAGVEIQSGGSPTIRNCRISRNGGSGVYVPDVCEGSVVNCDLTGNALGAWDIRAQARLHRQGNRE
jgi:parallel beta-helix repeat protein